MLKDIKSTLKHSFVYGLSNLSIKLLGLILMPIYTNKMYLSLEEYGALGVLEATSTILIAIFTLALNNGFNRWYWDNQYADKRNSLFYTILVSVISIAIFMCVLLIPSSSVLSGLIFGEKTYTYVISIMIGTSALQIIQNITNALMRLQSKSGYYSLVNILKLGVVLLATLYLVVFEKRGVSGIYEAQLIASVFYLILISPYVIRNIKPVFETAILKDIIYYSAPLMLASISGILLSAFDRYCLTYFGELPSVGIYSAGFKIANSIKVVVIGSVQLALMPLMYKKMNDANCKRFYSNVLKYFTFGVIMVVLFVSLFSYEILNIITVEKEYLNALYVIPLISFGLIFGMMKDTVVIGLNIKKKSTIVGKIIVSVAILNLVLNIIFIPLWGIIGASIATLISQFAYFVFTYKQSQKVFKVPYDIPKQILMIVVGVFIYALSYLSNMFPMVLAIIYKLAIIGLFPLILYLFRFYDEIEIKTIKEGWNKWKHISKFRSNIRNIKFK
jgi:O-antigen/teichoic acid export membrane protein